MDALSKAIRAWHASPYNFDKFGPIRDVSGKGQGAASYGRGLYVAENPKVSGPGESEYMREFAEHPQTKGMGGWTIPDDFAPHRDDARLTIDDSYYDGSRPDAEAVDEFAQNWVNNYLNDRHDDPNALRNLLDTVKKSDGRSLADYMNGASTIFLSDDEGGYDNGYHHSHATAVKNYLEGFGTRPGSLFKSAEDYYKHVVQPGSGGPYSYEVNLHLKPETILDWDAPMGDHHPEAHDRILDAHYKAMTRNNDNPPARSHIGNSPYWKIQKTGAAVYQDLVRQLVSDYAASEALYEAGIHGIRYKDGGSRDLEPKSFVIFQDGEYSEDDRTTPGGLFAFYAKGLHRAGKPPSGDAAADAIEDLYRAAARFPEGNTSRKNLEAAAEWAKINKPKVEFRTPPVTYNYAIFHPDFVEAVAQYNIKGEKIRDMGPGVHLKTVDHDPFKGEK